jgi:hypothetical protein
VEVGGKLFVGSSYWGNEAVFIRFSRVRVDRKKNPFTLSMVLFVICYLHFYSATNCTFVHFLGAFRSDHPPE